MVAPASSCTTGAQTVIKATADAISSVDGMVKVAQITTDIIGIVEHGGAVIGTAAQGTLDMCATVIDANHFIGIFKRFKDWTCPDEDGKMLWDKSWQSFVSMASLTGFSITALFSSLITVLKIAGLAAARFAFSTISYVCLIGYSVFDMWNSANKISDSKAEIAKLETFKGRWETRANEIAAKNDANWRPLVGQQVAKWTQKVVALTAAGPSEKLEQAVAKQNMWTHLDMCNDPAQLKAFCERKVERLSTAIENAQNTKTKSWLSVAYDVMLTALMVFCIAASFVTPVGVALTLFFVTGLVTSTMDLGNSIVDEILKKKAIPAELTVV